MDRVRLTPPEKNGARGARARLYLRWMPHLGVEAVALYELLRVLPEVGIDAVDPKELAEILRMEPEGVEEAFDTLLDASFLVERDGWLEALEYPPASRAVPRAPESPEVGVEAPAEEAEPPRVERESRREVPSRDVQVIRAEPEGVSPDDYFRFMGTLPAPHILEFLNGYCGRDGVSPDVVREALRIASERDARRVGYVRSILERWVERGVKTVEDVERFEKDRRLRLVEESGAVKGGALKIREGVQGGADRRPAAGFKEGYEWFFGE